MGDTRRPQEHEPAAPVEPRPAATVVLLRPGPAGPEILLTHRPAAMAFAGDHHVFPGGRVDPGDANPRVFARSALSPAAAAAGLGGDLDPVAALATYLAAIRELLEEAGVLLASPLPEQGLLDEARRALLSGEATLADIGEGLDLTFRTDLLAPIGHWTTPPIMPRRFDTRFFAAELPPGADPSFEVDEVVAHRWLTPRVALEAMAAGDISLWIPTSATLQQLEHASGLAQIREAIRLGPAAAPRVTAERAGITRIEVWEAGGVPGQSVNTYLVGERRIVIVDPGDPSDAAADAILRMAQQSGGELAAIALTHVDPDHAAGAEGLALRFGLPIYAGPASATSLPYAVRELGDGELVGDGDVSLEALATPGPRPDHVAYAVGDAVLVGDLAGGRATAAILGPADDAAWGRSLERLAQRGAATLFPGHGEPLGAGALVQRGSDAARFRR